MKILFDTHTFLWFLEGKGTLGDNALKAIQSIENTVYFSAVSYWEICIKISIGKLRLLYNWADTIDTILLENSIKWLDIKKEHMLKIINLLWYHRDPFDRLLIAQALEENCILCSTDNSMSKYNIEVIN